MKIAICDDEKKLLSMNVEILKECLYENKITADVVTYQSGDFLLYDIKENVYFDLILLDIEMPGKNGMEIAAEVKKMSSETLIIFITSHSEYAIDSFELSIFRYIPKDFIKAKLSFALKDALCYIEIQKNHAYVISTPTRYEKIPYRSIVYIQKAGKNSLIATSNLGDTQVRKSLNKVFEELNASEFVYIDRGCLINLIHIMRLDEKDVIMNNGVSLPVSKKRLKELRKAINDYWGKQI